MPSEQSRASRTIDEAVEASLTFTRIAADGTVTPEEHAEMSASLRQVCRSAELTEAGERVGIAIVRTGHIPPYLLRTHGALITELTRHDDDEPLEAA